ncbi:MAG TPA: bifunctional demethylmenaquinone methyltransferase/2-methoxy-6-polyprenyl-1,4-benzoquinol methylase UbiE [Saprospiraceae bacterium]|nr:bifunctional demethylmenaquinone methyltransferase/2-methoxy-6-polyprenyl-1,4-benzoquinol methylase UbiE [Saprospiraceae bacterium]
MNNQVTPYHTTESKKEQVAKMFNNISGSYDLNNRLLSAGTDQIWRKLLVKEFTNIKPLHILDVATGTGDVAIALVKKIHDLKVTGVDISDGMLAVGKHKLEALNLTDRIELANGDSENLVFKDNTFDGVTVAFGVRNFENLKKGLQEIYRVLNKGGKLAVLEFSKPVKQPFAWLFKLYFGKILPVIGRITSKDKNAYTYLFESVQAFPEGENFVKILDSIGYQKAQCKRLSLGICSLYTAYK